jgi:hypothetical protein
MRKTAIVALMFCMIVMLAAISPVLACRAETKYTFGVLSIDIPNTGTTSYTTNNIEIAKNHESTSWDFGHPWGPGLSSVITNFRLNVDSNSKNFLTGNGIDHFTTQYTTGTLKMITVLKFEGFGTLTYHGPNFAQVVSSYGKVAISDGDSFTGIMFTGFAIGYGTFSAEKARVQETMSGVVVLVGPLTGLNVICGTGSAYH